MRVSLLLVLLRHRRENGTFDLWYGGVVLTFLAGYTLWDRHYRRLWHNYRTRNWKKVDGRFDEGEVVTMLKGRSRTIAGYEVWLNCEYEAEGEQFGLYRLPLKSQDEAVQALSVLANQKIPVRVAPSKPGRSFVSDEDLTALLPTSVQSKNE